ncbi:MAG: histidine kinase, partial [Bacteroidota bacterium]|nr:histidine kinase [Bacteroidota bacterium]
MVHPVFRTPKSIIFYIVTWVVFIMAQILVLYYFYEFPFRNAIWDASIYLVFYGFLGLGLWYPIRFIYMSESKSYSKMLNFIGLGAGTLVLWQLLGSSLLRLVLNEHEQLIEFNELIMPVRLLAGALIFMILSLAYYLIIFYTSLEDRKINEVSLKAQARESELMMLKYQLNPHFLFNSLNSINSLTLSDPEKARNMIVKLSAYLRYSLESDQENFKELKREIDNIRRYLEIEKTRFGERINYEEFIDNSCLDQKVPSMILQPLFENA